MELQRIETPHNTPEQVAEYVQAAQDIADAAGIDREREPEVFVKIIDLVASKQITVVQNPPLLGGAMPLPGMRH